MNNIIFQERVYSNPPLILPGQNKNSDLSYIDDYDRVKKHQNSPDEFSVDSGEQMTIVNQELYI